MTSNFQGYAHRNEEHLGKFSLQKHMYKKSYPGMHNNCQDLSVLQKVL